MSEEQHHEATTIQAEPPMVDRTAWGQTISADRQAELLVMLHEWYAPDAEHSER